jgi:hypothetical protein
MLSRVAFVFGFLAVAGVMSVAPAFALGAKGPTIGPQVVIEGRAFVVPTETAGSIVIFDGPAIVAGTVNGSVVAFHGPVTIAGTVRGNVVSVSDRVVVLAGAHITGDVRSRDRAQISSQARVDGAVGGIDYSGLHDAVRIGRFIWWLGVTVSVLVLGLLVLFVPNAADGTVRAAAGRTGASVGWGLILFFGLPIVAVLLAVLVVTLPLGLALLLAFGLILLLGYANSVWLLGRLIVRAPRNRFLAFLAGWGIFRIVALLPIAGGSVWTLAAIFGLGAAAVAAWTARRGDGTVLVEGAGPAPGALAEPAMAIPPPPVATIPAEPPPPPVPPAEDAGPTMPEQPGPTQSVNPAPPMPQDPGPTPPEQ